MNQQLQRDRGSASLELAILTPCLLVFLAILILGGRVALARQAVQVAANDAARSASIARTQTEARSAATSAARSSIANQNMNCTGITTNVDTSQFSRPVGTAATITATVACNVQLRDLPVGINSIHVSATARSPLDTYRGRG